MRLKTNRGFTLIELMIVVVIVAIIAAIAYPSYQRHVQDTRRATAQADLLELAQWMERRYPLNNSYDLGGGALPFTVSPREGTTAYNLTVNVADANSFVLTATPTGPQAGDRCGTLTINQANERTANAGEPRCWQ